MDCQYTFAQIRSKINSFHQENKQTVYKKSYKQDFYNLFKFVNKTNHLDVVVDGRNRMKDKVYRDIFSKWIDSDFDLNLLKELYIKEYIAVKSSQQERLINKSKMSSSIVYEEHSNVIGNLPSSKFYNTSEWRSVRYIALKNSNGICQCCGSSPKNGGKPLHVDHIKPRSIYPELSLSTDNLQVLCEDCNLGKSNTHQDDWRK